jgi:hypothetical protein
MGKKIKIAKRHTDLPVPHHFVALDAIKWEKSDRGTVIVATAYLDLLLRGLLEKEMRQDEELLDTVFTNNGPLRDFSARIKLAHALNLIGTAAYADFNILRDIRNAFAHSAHILSFDTPNVAGMCRRLWYPVAPMINYGNSSTPTEPRDIFIRAVDMLSDGLNSSMLRKTPDPFMLMRLGAWHPGQHRTKNLSR